MKRYLLQTSMDGIRESSVRTGKEIADIYNTHLMANLFDSFVVYDIDGSAPRKISVYDIPEVPDMFYINSLSDADYYDAKGDFE